MKDLVSTNLPVIHNNLAWKFDARREFPKSMYRSGNVTVLGDACTTYSFTGYDFTHVSIEEKNSVHNNEQAMALNKRFGKTIQANMITYSKIDNTTMDFRYTIQLPLNEYNGEILFFIFQEEDDRLKLLTRKDLLPELRTRFALLGGALAVALESEETRNIDKFENENATTDFRSVKEIEESMQSGGIINYIKSLFKSEPSGYQPEPTYKDSEIIRLIRMVHTLNDDTDLLNLVKPLIDEFIHDNISNEAKEYLSGLTLVITVYRKYYP